MPSSLIVFYLDTPSIRTPTHLCVSLLYVMRLPSFERLGLNAPPQAAKLGHP